MVTNITSFSRSGLSDWIIQRASAVVMALYTVFLVVYLLAHPQLDYATWSGLFEQTWMRIFSLLAFVSLAAHAWVGLGRIVYASSMDQLVAWLGELGASAPPVAALSINAIAPDVPVDGPDAELAPAVRALHARAVRRV